jgi:hypothetical protein
MFVDGCKDKKVLFNGEEPYTFKKEYL